MASFNVITDKWIPTIMIDGTKKVFGIRDLLQNAKNIKRITSPGNLPSEEYAIYRFLFAFITDAYKIRSDQEIEKIYKSGEFDMNAFDQYVEDAGSIFDVFDEEHPFMQCGIEDAVAYGAKPKSAASFSWGALSGRTETFFGSRDLPVTSTYEAAQSLSIPEYISLCINITFMQSAKTSGFPAAVCDNQPPLWVRLNGRTLFDTLCLNLYPTTENDIPLWRRDEFLWQPTEAPTGWLSLAFLPTRIIAPYEDGLKNGRFYEVLLNECFYRKNSMLTFYKEPRTFYDWWLAKEPYVIVYHNESPKRKDTQREVSAWRGPSSSEWMHMVEFYGAKLDNAWMERPRIMEEYEGNEEKGLIKLLPYRPTQVFYKFDLPTQQKKANQEVFDDFPEIDDWMFDDSKLSVIQRYTAFVRYAMTCVSDAIRTMLYPSAVNTETTAVDDYVNNWASGLSDYLYQTLIPDLKDINEENEKEHLTKACDAALKHTRETLRSIHTRDAFVKYEVIGKTGGRLQKYIENEFQNDNRKENS